MPNSSKIGFVHIPKTGGTAALSFLDGCSQQVLSNGHMPIAGWYLKHRIRPIAMLREPTDRFGSLFAYWKYGTGARVGACELH